MVDFPDPLMIEDILYRLFVSTVLFGVLIALSFWKKVQMEKKFFFSFLRGILQILLVASVLIVIFGLTDVIIMFFVLFIMSIFASLTAKRNFPFPHMFRIHLMGITLSSLFVMGFAVIIGIIPSEGAYIIPMGGMVIANVMVMTGVTLERLIADIKKSKGVIEAALSLGDSATNSIRTIAIDAYRAGLLPSTNRVAILGVVTIPGLMSGMIIGGINPIIAGIYQIIIFLMILVAGFSGEIIVTIFFLREIFNDDLQLNMQYFSDGYNSS
ncbi:MAG: ABC transporter permease [Candidatus Hodarchaeales archaeon]